MGINRKKEELIPLKKARGLFPSHPAIKTIRHWCAYGYRGVLLERIKVLGRVYTSREAADRFLDRTERKRGRA